MKYCPKCEQCFFINLEIAFCDFHKKEYKSWDEDKYIPEKKCKCGCEEFVDGTLQLTYPPTFPEMLVYKCKNCDEVQLEKSSKHIRIFKRKQAD